METSQSKAPPPADVGKPEQIVMVPIEKIVESKNSIRKSFDPGAEKDLIASIATRGIIEPLHLRPLNGQFELVEGTRRFRAAKIAKLQDVPAIVRPYTDDDVIEIQLISFSQKEGLHALDEAEAYNGLVKRKYDVAQISAKIGKERSYIAKRLQLVTLIDAGKKAFRKNEIYLDHALQIARLQPKDQEKALEFVLEGDMAEPGMPNSIEYLKHFIQDEFELDLRKASFDKKDPNLVGAAASCTNCPKRSGFNKDLFNDITAADHCMDPRCFEAKMKAHLQIRKSELQRQGETVVLITPEMRKPVGYPEAITCRSYVEVNKDACEHTKTGLVVGGSGRGQVKKICTEKSCKKHGGKNPHSVTGQPSKAKTPEAQEKERLKKVKETIDKEVNERLEDAVLPLIAKALPDQLRRKDLETIYEFVESNLYGDVESKMKTALDLKGKPTTWSDKKLARAIALALMFDMIQNGYSPDGTAGATARELKIDVAPIEKNIRAEVEKLHADELKSQLETNAKEAQKPQSGTCRICSCTQATPCISKSGVACAWIDKSKTLCDNPKCIEWDKKAKAKAKLVAKPEAKKTSKKKAK